MERFEDFNTGLVKYGVSDYAAPRTAKIAPPARPQITFEPEHEADVLDASPDVLRLM